MNCCTRRHQARRLLQVLGAAWTALTIGVAGANAQSIEAFYKSKTILMIVPADPGGSYDLHTRLLARHFAKWIPGRPHIVVQNMQGAGGLRAINYLYEKAPKDGTVLAMPVQENVIADVLGGADVRYKVPEFNWIGRLAPGSDVILTWHRYGVRTIDDAKIVSVPLGATGPASGTSLYPLMLNSVLGTKFTIISGYRHNEMLLAIERGETGGAFSSLATLKSTYPTWLAEKKISLLLAFATERVPELPDVNILTDLGRTLEEKQVLAIFASASEIGRSLMTAPHVPEDRIAALRAAFDATLKDPEFLADLRKTHAEFGPMSGAALQRLVADTRNVPPHVLERARDAIRR